MVKQNSKYIERKLSNRCVNCGTKLEKGYYLNLCQVCLLKNKVGEINSRLKKVERFIDKSLDGLEDKDGKNL